MRITVGVKSLKEADYFLRHGADEIYFGPPVPNFHGSFSTEKEIAATIKLARRSRKKTLLALNGIYPEEKYGFLLEHARRMLAEGLDGINARSPALLEYFNAKGLRAYYVSSIECACFNSQAVEFYRDLGVRRFTLHSQVLPEDAAKIIKLPGLETVIFVPCLFLEANIIPFCFFGYPASAGGAPPELACTQTFKCGRHDFRMLSSNLYFQANLLYDFHKLGVDWLKVPRQQNVPKLMAEFEITRYLNQLLEKKTDRPAFAAAVTKLIEKIDINKYGPSHSFKPLAAA